MTITNTQTIEREEIKDSSSGNGERFGVIIFDNDTNTVDEVVAILLQATNCPVDEAVIEMWEAHTYGKSWVHFSSEEECNRVAEVIARIGVTTDVRKEWAD